MIWQRRTRQASGRAEAYLQVPAFFGRHVSDKN
jgi:hypothetical protein